MHKCMTFHVSVCSYYQFENISRNCFLWNGIFWWYFASSPANCLEHWKILSFNYFSSNENEISIKTLLFHVIIKNICSKAWIYEICGIFLGTLNWFTTSKYTFCFIYKSCNHCKNISTIELFSDIFKSFLWHRHGNKILLLAKLFHWKYQFN